MMASVSNEIAAFLAEQLKIFLWFIGGDSNQFFVGKTEKFSAESKVSPLQNNSSFRKNNC